MYYSKDEHSLWIGTINGVFVFDKLKKQAIPLDTEFDIQCINMIYNDRQETIHISVLTVTDYLFSKRRQEK